MAARYWVGGSATWDATAGAKWSTTSGGAGGAAVPTGSDFVYFNAASGVVTVTIAAGMNLDSIHCTGFTGTLTGGTLYISGANELSAGGNYSGLSLATNGLAATLTTAGATIGDLTTGGGGGGCTVVGALNVVGVLTIGAGGLTLPHSTTHSIGSLATTGSTYSTLKSSSAGIAATLTATSNSATLTRLSIQDMTATGGVTWRADPATCTDVSGNTGWLFSLYVAPAALFFCDF